MVFVLRRNLSDVLRTIHVSEDSTTVDIVGRGYWCYVQRLFVLVQARDLNLVF